MRDMERLQHQLHAKLPAFQRRLDWTQQIIEDALTKCGTWYCAYSSGIDSMVVLDLLYSSGYRVDVRWSDDGYDYPESIQFLAETEQRYHFRLHRTRNMHSWRLWCDEMACPDLCNDPEALRVWGNPHQWDDTRTSSQHEEHLHGYGGVFMGLLASESRNRSYALRDGYNPLYQVKSEGGMWHCSPLAAWDKRDVWAYAISRNLPYNAVYNKLAAMDIPLERRRVAPLTCFRTMQYGSVVHLKRGWPDLYNKLAETFPQIRSYS